MSEDVKKSLFVQGTILAAAGIITKMIGFIYRIPMANILGDQGNGIYSVAFGIYNIALTLSSYSMPQAVSKLVAEKIATGQERNKIRIFIRALIFAFIAGMAAFALLWAGADALEALYHRQGLSRPLRVLAPTSFIVALLGTFRGFFQGHRTMVPTAVSQILEQIINAVVSVAAAYGLTRMYSDSPDVHAYGAMGGTLGTLTGAAAALVFFIILTLSRSGSIKRSAGMRGADDDTNRMMYRAIFLTVIPIILSQTIYQIGNTIDDLIFGTMMENAGVSDAVAASLQGAFHTQYLQLVNLPVAIATAMAASTLPTIAAACIVGELDDARSRAETVVKFNMAIAIPSAVGLAVLAYPIVALLFPRLVDYRAVAATLLITGSSAVVFYALSTITTSILQGTNNMSVPVKHSAISLVIHIILVYALLKYTDLGIYAILIGNVTFPLLVCLMNLYSIKNIIGKCWTIRTSFLMPLAAAVLMGAAAWLIYTGIYKFTHIMVIGLLVSVAAAVVIYGAVILKMKCFTRDELLQFPMGGRLVRLAKIK